jgi:hypothetical protein
MTRRNFCIAPSSPENIRLHTQPHLHGTRTFRRSTGYYHRAQQKILDTKIEWIIPQDSIWMRSMRKRLATPTKQILAPLPFFRQPSARLHLFNYAAIDCAGPYYTKVGRANVKRWLLVIHCATIGAVHFEMMDTMDTYSFLLALEQFLALRPQLSGIIHGPLNYKDKGLR